MGSSLEKLSPSSAASSSSASVVREESDFDLAAADDTTGERDKEMSTGGESERAGAEGAVEGDGCGTTAGAGAAVVVAAGDDTATPAVTLGAAFPDVVEAAAAAAASAALTDAGGRTGGRGDRAEAPPAPTWYWCAAWAAACIADDPMNTEGTRAFLGDLLLCLFFAAAAAAAATDTMCAEGLAGVAGGASVGAGAGLAHRAMPCNRKSIGNAKALR
jgi:hypothetical protein